MFILASKQLHSFFLWSSEQEEAVEGYGVNGCFLAFLKGLYGGSVSQVRVDRRLARLRVWTYKGLRKGVCYLQFSFPCTSTV